MTLKQLRYFLAVADTGRFVQAAADVRVAQPTLSRQIQALEDDLGETLFTRGRDHVTLTSAGDTLLPLARRIVADVETARLEIAELADLRRGRLRLGATPSLCVSVVADVLAVFHASYPGISLQISEGGSQDLVADLEDGQLDLALLIHQADRLPTAALALTPVLREELVAVSATAGQTPLDEVLGDHAGIAEIARHPMVLNRPGYELREAVLSACAAAGVTPRIAVEGGEMDAVLRMVERGLGVAIVPSLVLAGRSGLRPTRLDGSGWTHRTIALAHRTDVSPTRAAEAFRETLLAVLARTSRTGGLPPGVRFIHPA
ncbi:LysR substrate-binding domain-containing protein [Actinomycetospora sp. OC33-EN08]|uniref:LysR substrate-binding domain-containing protein n=1 Tax=Actinomycetospora aurantiaca TaxID=3129233 RepID=A0ABU8MMI0_9PSEU